MVQLSKDNRVQRVVRVPRIGHRLKLAEEGSPSRLEGTEGWWVPQTVVLVVLGIEC